MDGLDSGVLSLIALAGIINFGDGYFTVCIIMITIL